MLGIILWTQPASILQHCFVPLQRHSNCQRTCIDPYIQFLSFCASITMSWIISLHRAHSLRHYALEEGIPSLIITALRDQTCSPFKYPTSHVKPATHRKMPDKPSTQREYCSSCDYTGDVGNHTSSSPL